MALMFKHAVGPQLAGAPSGAGTNSEESEEPDVRWVFGAYALVLAGGAAAWILFEVIDPKDVTPAEGFTVFAPLYVLAQAIERLMEPFAKYLGTTKVKGGATKTQTEAKNDLEEAIVAMSVPRDSSEGQAAATAGEPPVSTTKATKAAEKLAVVTRIRRNTTVIAWGIASAAAMVLCGIFGLRLLGTMGMDVHWEGLDVVITGLAVGSGTKPLHDLISNVQKAKEKKSDPPQAAST